MYLVGDGNSTCSLSCYVVEPRKLQHSSAISFSCVYVCVCMSHLKVYATDADELTLPTGMNDDTEKAHRLLY